MSNYGCALEYASTRLKRDEEVVIAAARNDGEAIKYASPFLQNDDEIINECKK